MRGITRERDPNLIKLENNVFSLLKNIGLEEDERVGHVEPPKTIKSSLPTALSIEDAIKELIQIHK